MKLIGSTRVTFGANATVAALLAAGTGDTTIKTQISRVAIIPDAGAAAVYLRSNGTDACTNAYPLVPASGISMPTTATSLALIRMFSAGATGTILQYGN
jgi:hypothetical protein